MAARAQHQGLGHQGLGRVGTLPSQLVLSFWLMVGGGGGVVAGW